MNNFENGSGVGVIGTLFYLAVIAFYLYCMWRLFEKAGKPGWAALIPIYNVLVELEIIGRPWWWLLLMLVPVVDIVIGIMIYLDLAKVFGKESGFAIGLIFLSFIAKQNTAQLAASVRSPKRWLKFLRFRNTA